MWTLSPPTSPPAEGGAGAPVLAVRTTSEWWRWPWWGARRDQWSERGERTVMGLTKQPSLSMTTSSVRKEREIFPTILQIISYSGIVSGYISLYHSSFLYNESWKYWALLSSLAGCGQTSEGGGGETQLKCKHYRTGGDIRLSQEADTPDTRWGVRSEG